MFQMFALTVVIIAVAALMLFVRLGDPGGARRARQA